MALNRPSFSCRFHAVRGASYRIPPCVEGPPQALDLASLGTDSVLAAVRRRAPVGQRCRAPTPVAGEPAIALPLSGCSRGLRRLPALLRNACTSRSRPGGVKPAARSPSDQPVVREERVRGCTDGVGRVRQVIEMAQSWVCGVVCVKFSKLVHGIGCWVLHINSNIFLFEGRDHPFVPTCPLAERRAQRQSRMPPRRRRHRRSRRAASLTERARC